MKRINVAYFAKLREERGRSEETLETEADTPAALYEVLCGLHQFTLRPAQLGVAVNDAFAPWDTALKDGDTVVFIPPVAGG